MKLPLVVLTGPTAVGKTAISIQLAQQINGAVISADSMQIYRYMDIGSAKIKKEEMGGIPHYLVDILDPKDEFHVVRFQHMATAAIKEIYDQGKLPIVVGGTGFYIQALLNHIDFQETGKNDGYREVLAKRAQEKGSLSLYEELKQTDPKAAEKIHPNNVKRVIRALEFHHDCGLCISMHNEREKEKESFYNSAYFVLNDERERLYRRIDKRVDLMMEEGLLKEVSRLKGMGYTKNMVAMQGLGYKELLEYLEGAFTLEEAVCRIKRDTRHFAKRQLTWFKRERDVIWLEKPCFGYDDNKIIEEMLALMRKREILK